MRYRNMLPLQQNIEPVSFNECFTPLEQIKINNKPFFLKHDYLLPSGSYKDRGASVLISVAKSKNIKQIIEDSSGNAGASMAAYAAKAGINCRILVPQATSEVKTAQISAYQAELIKVQGDRDNTTQEALKQAENTYYASHIFNPLFCQGIKTLAYEICEQLNWKSPENIITPAANGTLVIGLYLGFNELYQSQIIPFIPRIIAIQASNCAPLSYFLKYQNLEGFTKNETIAEGIAIGNPARLRQITEIINKTKGIIITVEETEIISEWKKAMKNGILIEPTSAVVFAAMNSKLTNDLSGNTVIMLTGSGLKSLSKLKI